MTSWAQIAGDDIAAIASPLHIRWPKPAKTDEPGTHKTGATLTLGCEAAFALDLSYRTQQLMARVNRYFGYAAIAQVRVVQSPNHAIPARTAVAAAPAPVASPKAPGTAADLPQALEMLGESVKRDAARHAARRRP